MKKTLLALVVIALFNEPVFAVTVDIGKGESARATPDGNVVAMPLSPATTNAAAAAPPAANAPDTPIENPSSSIGVISGSATATSANGTSIELKEGDEVGSDGSKTTGLSGDVGSGADEPKGSGASCTM